MYRRGCLIALASLACPSWALPAAKATEVAWMSSYADALAEARRQGRMLLVYFYDAGSRHFQRNVLEDPSVRRGLQDYVCVRLPLAVAGDYGRVLLTSPSLKEMLRRPGVAIIDNTGPGSWRVVSTFPITHRACHTYTPEKMCVILNLPPGTLTQRTLIYAVRTHPEGPASTGGTFDPVLAKEAERHSLHQARIQCQGHHNWDQRFRRINTVLPAGLVACEVCAESWPGESLVEAAIECVRSWRTSPGHWDAVNGACPVYGYDMKRGRNGIWYATGIFGQDPGPMNYIHRI